jgi:hypothetical protein
MHNLRILCFYIVAFSLLVVYLLGEPLIKAQIFGGLRKDWKRPTIKIQTRTKFDLSRD